MTVALQTMMFVWSMVQQKMKVVWNFATETSGQQSVA